MSAQTSNGRSVLVQGRIVWIAGGNLWKGDLVRDQNTKQVKLNQQGEQIRQYGFGLAVPKAQCQEIWNAMHEEAFTMFPNFRQTMQQTGQMPPNFAMKFKDGDTSVDEDGVPYNKREGYPGHLVLACTTTIPMKMFKWENGANIQVPDGIKCGDYVNVQVTIKAHPAINNGKAGLYLNPMAVQFLGYGKEIINTPSGDQIFGLAQPPMPQGASAVPLAPQGQTPLVMTGSPQQGPYAPPAQPSFAPPAMPQAPQVAQPHHAVLPPQFQPPAQPQFAPPAPMQQNTYQQQVPNGYGAPPVAVQQMPAAQAPYQNPYPAQAAYPSNQGQQQYAPPPQQQPYAQPGQMPLPPMPR